MRKMFIAGLLILALAGGALAGDGVEILGLTHQEVVEVLGRPAYIKVFDYGPAQKYAYFTLDEWEMIGDLAPLAQGEDVYIRSVEGAPFQFHVVYTPIYLGPDRFSPVFRVGEYTMYPEVDLSLGRLAAYVPQGELLLAGKAKCWFKEYEEPYLPTIIVQIDGPELSAGKYLRRFREGGPVQLELEVGLERGTSLASLTPATRVVYITLRPGVFQGAPGKPVPVDVFGPAEGR
ncbi:MAG: hypothetical protein ACOX20_05240 [Limnochordia bacterium]|jgi:hypothetical protein|nr:hypothetical protein [Bacillota bacterium]